MVEPIQLRKKVCLLGDAAVGKTSLIRRFVFNQFDEKYITTIGTNVSKKDLNIDISLPNDIVQNYDLTFAIWDIIGQKELHSFNLNYFKNANGGIVVCDITRKETLDSLDMWTSSLFNITGNIPLVYIANKYDLSSQAAFAPEELGQIAEKFNSPYYLASALNGENVESAFQSLGKNMVLNTVPENVQSQDDVSKIASEIILEFSKNVGGIERGIPLIKEIFKISGVDFLEPTKDQLVNALPDVVQLLRDLKGSDVASQAEHEFSKIMVKLQ